LACPFFMPVQKLEGGWFHPARLPLGGGWGGHCSAPGHDDFQPSDEDLRELCNLGYATKCSRLPVQRDCDAVRFSVARDQGSRLLVRLVFEAGHRPVKHGTAEYDVDLGTWIAPLGDLPIPPNIWKMLECYVESYLQRRMRPVVAGAAESVNP
jgi:hypothetical protein